MIHDFKKNPPKGLIWFYRDLRVSDHAGLELIRNSGGNWVAIVLAPPHPDSAAGYFEQECQSDLEQSLRKFQIPLLRILAVEAKSLIETLYETSNGSLDLLQLASNARETVEARADWRIGRKSIGRIHDLVASK